MKEDKVAIKLKRIKRNLFNNEWNTGVEHNFDYFRPKNGMINNQNCPLIFFDIISLFARDCDYKLKECYIDAKRLFIIGIHKEGKCELMLRFAGSKNKLVVAKVCFVHQRCGNMTELYKILENIKRRYKTGKIVIESVMTEGMKQWCKKNGFEKKEESMNYEE